MTSTPIKTILCSRHRAKRTRKSAAAEEGAKGGAKAGDDHAPEVQATNPPLRSRKKAKEVAETVDSEKEAAPKAKRSPRKPAPPAAPAYDLSLRRPRLPSDPKTPTIICWNVAGLRGLLKKEADAISQLVASEDAQILCLQEVKLQTSHIDEELHDLLKLDKSWHAHWNCSTEKKGYSGTAILSR